MSQSENTRRRAFQEPTDDELRNAIPRDKRRLEFRVGIFVLVGIASTLVALFLFTDPSTFRGRYRVTTDVVDAGGIRRGDPVQMRGVNIGRVLGFSMDPRGVEITLEIEGAWDIPADSRTKLASGGILGGRTVQIVEGTSEETIGGGGHLSGESAGDIMDLAEDLGEGAQSVLGQIQELLAEPTVGAIQESAHELQGLLSSLSQLADEQGREIADLTSSLNRSAAGLEEAAGSGEDLARAVARADSALAVVQQTSQVVLEASEALQTILRRMEAGEGTLGQLSANPALYETLTAAIESVKLLTDDIRENPGRYVKIEIF